MGLDIFFLFYFSQKDLGAAVFNKMLDLGHAYFISVLSVGLRNRLTSKTQK
jgi:hypothetical protein